LKFGDKGYPYARDWGFTWVCVPCRAWVGCHDGTQRPLGTLANSELRIARKQAHSAFDPIWMRKMRLSNCTKQQARSHAYRWLAEKLGIEVAQCRIALMDVEQCSRVVWFCKNEL
jgi:hypothetical protein